MATYNKIKITGTNLRDLTPIFTDMGYILKGCIENECSGDLYSIALNRDVKGVALLSCSDILMDIHIKFKYPGQLNDIISLATIYPSETELITETKKEITYNGEVKITLGKRKGEIIPKEGAIILWNGNIVHKDEPTSKFTKGMYKDKLYSNSSDKIIKLKDGFTCSNNDSIIIINSTSEKILYNDKGFYKVEEDNTLGGYEFIENMISGYISGSSKGWFSETDDVIFSEYKESYYINTSVANRWGLAYDEDSGDYVPKELIDRLIWDYHHGERTNEGITSKTKFTVGFEIEKEDGDIRIKEKAKKLFNRTGWSKEKDGSLNMETGFELISPVFDLFDNKIIEKSFEKVKDYIDAKYNKKTCGGHINFSIIGENRHTIFDKVSGYLPLLYSMYENRMGERYCQAKKKNDLKFGDKYAAIAVKENRIEIRIFSAVRNIKQLKWRLKFMQIVANNLTNSAIKVLKMAINPETELHKHLLEVYNLPMLKNRVYRALEHYQNIEDIPISSKTKDRFKILTKGKAEEVNLELDNIFDEITQIEENRGNIVTNIGLSYSLAGSNSIVTWSPIRPVTIDLTVENIDIGDSDDVAF